MTGRLYVIGIGPGNREQMTAEAVAAIGKASHFFGYKPYLDRLELRSGQTVIASDNREELARAGAALDLAARGETVAMISGGDAGVFAMAAAVCEAIESGPEDWRALDLVVVPGVTAMLAVAARIGAPLGNDFCAVSLSDNLKPWAVIENRLKLAAEAGFVMALYNPISKARPHQLGQAFRLLRDALPLNVPVVFGRAVGRPDERIEVVPLGKAQPEMADMSTCIIVGNVHSRTIERDDRPALLYTPRSVPSDG